MVSLPNNFYVFMYEDCISVRRSKINKVAEDLKHVSEWWCTNHCLINPEKKQVCPFLGEATHLQVDQ